MEYNRLQWENWYSLATDYYADNGNLLIKRDYITPDGFKLGRWIERQRGKYNGKIPSVITDECVAMLEAIGMVWKLETRTTFDNWISVCKLYYDEFGNLLVPKSVIYENLPLGEWIVEQRKQYSKQRLSNEKIEKLEGVGMVWSLSERRPWADWYKDAKEYYTENGNLLVPLNYITANGNKLGLWVFTQRDKRKYRPNYPIEMVNKLDKIGMVWSLKEVRNEKWEQMYTWVQQYIYKHGKLPLWPKKIPAPDGRYLDVWIATQRKQIKCNKLSAYQIDKLKKIGIE